MTRAEIVYKALTIMSASEGQHGDGSTIVKRFGNVALHYYPVSQTRMWCGPEDSQIPKKRVLELIAKHLGDMV